MSFYLSVYFFIIKWYLNLTAFLFNFIPRIYLVKDANTRRNMTLQYYLGSSAYGSYFVKIITRNGTHYTIFTGHLNEINNIIVKKDIVKRRNVILFDNDDVLDFDLNILDDYYVQTGGFKTVKDVCYIIGYNCTHLRFIDEDYEFEETEAEQVHLFDLYL